MTEHDIFAAAIKLTGDQRAAFLKTACGDDQALRCQVEALLKAHDESGGLLPKPPDRELEATRLAPSQDKPGMLIGGRYKLLENIGEGGMGAVWIAEQQAPVKRKVAIKFVKAGMDSRQVLARFEAERQALAMMDHPNIAKVFDGGLTDQGRPYFVMEYVKGVPFTEYCDRARLSLKERLCLFIPVCQAIQHAHHKGIVHRDLKPSNVLICLYDGKPVPKVIDFGLAKALHHSLTDQTLHTSHGVMVGTPLYMSPEQAEYNNLDVDTRTDIYSLGVVLYELLTGTTPLERQQLQKAAYEEVLRLIKEVEPLRPSIRLSGSASLPSVAAQRSIDPRELRRSLAGDLDWIVMKALEKERSRRYETANGLARDIERFLNDEAVEACPPSRIYQLKKLVKKHKGKAIAASVVFATLLLGIIGTTWGLFRAIEAESKAIQSESNANNALSQVAQERDAKELARKLESKERERAEKQMSELERQAYRMGLQSAQRSIEQGDGPAAIEALQTCPETLRSWEWNILSAKADASIRTNTVPDQQDIVAVSSNGQYAVLKHRQRVEHAFCIWRTYDNAIIHRFSIPNSSQLLKAAVNKDASRVAVITRDDVDSSTLASTVYLWDATSQKIIWSLHSSTKETGNVLGYGDDNLKISADGRRLLIPDVPNVSIGNLYSFRLAAPETRNLFSLTLVEVDNDGIGKVLLSQAYRDDKGKLLGIKDGGVIESALHEFETGAILSDHADYKIEDPLLQSQYGSLIADYTPKIVSLDPTISTVTIEPDDFWPTQVIAWSIQSKLAVGIVGNEILVRRIDVHHTSGNAIALSFGSDFQLMGAPNPSSYAGLVRSPLYGLKVDFVNQLAYFFSESSVKIFPLPSESMLRGIAKEDIVCRGRQTIIAIEREGVLYPSVNVRGTTDYSLQRCIVNDPRNWKPENAWLSNDESLLAIASRSSDASTYNSRIQIFSLNGDQTDPVHTIIAPVFPKELSFSRDGRYVCVRFKDTSTFDSIAAGGKERLNVMEVRSKDYGVLNIDCNGEVQIVDFPSSELLILDDGVFRTFDITGKTSASSRAKIAGCKYAKANAAGTVVAIVDGRTVSLRLLPSWDLSQTYECLNQTIQSIHWNPEGTRLMLIGNGSLTCIDATNGQFLFRAYRDERDTFGDPTSWSLGRLQDGRFQPNDSEHPAELWKSLIATDSKEQSESNRAYRFLEPSVDIENFGALSEFQKLESPQFGLALLRQMASFKNAVGWRVTTELDKVDRLSPSTHIKTLARSNDDFRVRLLMLEQLEGWTASEINGFAWEAVRKPESKPERSRLAVERMLSMIEGQKEDKSMHFWLNTLGVAYYRVGNYQKCIESLERSEALLVEKKSLPSNQIFMAMAYAKLSETSKAIELMAAVKELAETKSLAEEDMGFFEEAKKVLYP